MPIFDQAHPKIIEITFNFPEFAPPCKKLVNSINSFFPSTPTSGHANPEIFWSTINLCEFVSTCKNQAISMICSGDMVDKKILQSDWLRTFWPISQDIFPHISGHFSQIWHLCMNIADNIHVHYRTNSVKIYDKNFQYLQKALFLAFSQFWG